VTGAARSGTAYTAELLRQLSGLPVSHEDVFGLHERTAEGLKVGGKTLDPFGDPPSWGYYRICVSWLAMPFLDRLPEDVLVIHQIRHPIRAIRSIYRRRFLRRGSPYGEFAMRALDGYRATTAYPIWPTDLQSACEYWVRWNHRISSTRSNLYWRVEDLHSAHWILEPLLEHVVGDIRKPVTHLERIDVPTNLNTGGYQQDGDLPATLDGIPEKWRAQVWGLGRRFGYEL
jgi:hypothetical protein